MEEDLILDSEDKDKDRDKVQMAKVLRTSGRRYKTFSLKVKEVKKDLEVIRELKRERMLQ